MSLQVWLPLRGDLTNNGLSDVIVENNGAVVNEYGKIGSCYSFGSSKSYLKFNNMDFIHNFTECSVSLWLQILQWNSAWEVYFQLGLGSTSWANYIFALSRNGTQSTLCFTIYNKEIGGTTNTCLTPVLELKKWYHITVTYTNGHCKIYIDGTQIKDLSTNVIPDFSGITTGYIGAINSGNSYQTNCLMNDFRIYNHALSQKQIKQIAKGLILHYKLDSNGYNEDNIIRDCSGYENDGQIIGEVLIDENSPRYGSSVKLKGRASSVIKVTDNKWMVQGADSITINFWAKAVTWPTNGGRCISCTEGGGFNLQAGSSGYWRFAMDVYTNEAQTSRAYQSDSLAIKIADLIPNTWNMITLTYNRNGSQTYINGLPHHTYVKSNYGIHFNKNARLFLGCEANTASPKSPYFNGWLSDFRIYGTVLNDDDIRELYQVQSSVDRNNNIYVREIIEE